MTSAVLLPLPPGYGGHTCPERFRSVLGVGLMSEGDLGGFGDQRLRDVGSSLLRALQVQPTVCVQALTRDRAQAVQFGRFLANHVVSAAEMLAHAGQLTAQRAVGRHVLAVQDTTELHFSGETTRKRGFGASGNGAGVGLFLHPVLAVDAGHGGILGLVDAEVLNRTGGSAAPRHGRAADDKESRRWLRGAEAAGSVLESAGVVTVVGDAESDIYDAFARWPAGVHLLVRAGQDRALAGGGTLMSVAASWAVRDRYDVAVPQRGARRARTATVALRWGEVSLRRPAPARCSLAASVALRVVDAIEVDPPAGEPPLHWCLLTTHAVDSLDQARTVLGWYRARWTIEQVFRTLKSAGKAVEASQVPEAGRFVKLATAALVAAVRTMQLVMARDGTTAQPLSDGADTRDLPMLHAVCTKVEGRTAALKNPHASDTLAWLAWIVARLGGWAGYQSKGYKPPGPLTITRGLAKLDAIAQGWALARSGHV